MKPPCTKTRFPLNTRRHDEYKYLIVPGSLFLVSNRRTPYFSNVLLENCHIVVQVVCYFKLNRFGAKEVGL